MQPYGHFAVLAAMRSSAHRRFENHDKRSAGLSGARPAPVIFNGLGGGLRQAFDAGEAEPVLPSDFQRLLDKLA